jgi:transcriptional regulator with XRE-family HTH domain
MHTLRQVRVARLMTMRDLAARSGVSLSTVQGVETGKTTPSLRVIGALATALEVAPGEVAELAAAIAARQVAPYAGGDVD